MRSITVLVIIGLAALPAAAASFNVVSTLDDGGYGTLRWAIEQANATPEPDDIVIGSYPCPYCQPHTEFRIVLQRALPEVRDASISSYHGYIDLIIDAKLVEGDGLVMHTGISNLTILNAGGNGLVVDRDYASVGHCRATGNRGAGFVLRGKGLRFIQNVSTGNGTGVRIEGEELREVYDNEIAGNPGTGIHLAPSARDNTIGGDTFCCFALVPFRPPNVISANGGDGILVEGDGNRFTANLVGSSPATGNRGHGIHVTGLYNEVGGATTSYNGGSGIYASSPARTFGDGVCNGGPLMDAGPPGRTSNDVPDLDGVLNAPEITKILAFPDALLIEGVLHAEPDRQYEIYLIGRSGDCGSAFSYFEGRLPITVRTDGRGDAAFRRVRAHSYGTSVQAFTYDFSRTSETTPLQVVPHLPSAERDLEIVMTVTEKSATSVRFTTAITNHGPSPVYELTMDVSSPVPHFASLRDAEQSWNPNEAWQYEQCAHGTCRMTIAPGETRFIDERMDLPRTGSKVVIRREAAATSDPNPANNTATLTIDSSARQRAARH